MTDQQPYAQQPAPPQAGAPKKPLYKRAWFIILMTIIVLIVLVAALGGDSDDESSATDTSAGQDTGNDGAGDSGSDGDAQDGQDGPAQLGETVSMDKADITASDLRVVQDALGTHLCTDVSVAVTGDDSLRLNGLMDWKLTDPNGVTLSQSFGGETDYDSVEVGPGGHRDGTVCFDAPGDPGDYTLVFEEGLSFSSDHAEWQTTL